MPRTVFLYLFAFAAIIAAPPQHGIRPAKMVVRNALIIEGNGTPASGPRDIAIENGRISAIMMSLPVGNPRRIPEAPVEIDAAGKYVMPGLISMHAHTQDERAGKPQDVNYCLKLWLACGITTVRDVGSVTAKTIKLREQSEKGEIAAPRIFVYPMLGMHNTPEAARARVREIKAQGGNGMKMLGVYRDVMQAALEEAHAHGLPVAHHTGVEETNAWDDIKFGTTTIEHWYGIPDAALDGVQSFPAAYNYQDEVDRFRYAGRLWREAKPEKLAKVLDGMVKAGVAWDPTLNIYEASRDLTRAQNLPWFKEYLHPSLEAFFRPNRQNHGSYFIGWSTEDEVYWKENYLIWMAALKDFARRGGVITTGEDAGYIYQMYGFGLLRELELHQEAGFHPLEVIQHATQNGAQVLKQANNLGRVRAGYSADLLIVNGNPLANFKVLNPMYEGGGIEWTIKAGIPYNAQTLMQDVAAIVKSGK